MKPVFKEEMDYLGIDIILENYLWVNSRCYYAYDQQFNKVKFGRALEKLPKDNSNLITHKEYTDFYYRNHTVLKVELERTKFKEYVSTNNIDEIIISVSGGKDSTVTHHMVDDISRDRHKTRVLFGNTSNETHYTYKYVKDIYGKDLEICNPKEGFYQWIDRTGFIPTRLGRACCSVFKEGNITPYLGKDYNKKLLHICGIRKDESLSRSTYEQITKGKWNNKEALFNWNMYLPIIDFNDLDVWSYIFYHNLPFNRLYEFGYGRVGCTNCPFRTNYELELNGHFLTTYSDRWNKLIGYIFDRDGLALNINCTKEEFLKGGWKGGLFRENPTNEVIQEFADNKNISIDKAKKYFKNNKCTCCGKRITKDMIALNMKLLGRDTNSRLCLKHLAEFVDTDVAKLKHDIDIFKQQGCGLF